MNDPRTDADMTDLYGYDYDPRSDPDWYDDYCLQAQMEQDFWYNYNRGWNP
jgi:hypothetical protein